jgi:hypothetical protein
MLRIIEDELAVRRYAQQFLKTLKSYVTHRWSMTLGYPGGSFRARLNWLESLGIWYCTKPKEAEVHWQAFGAGKPRGLAAAITCEINLPRKGIDRRVTGALAHDAEGRIYIVHRGRLGGKKGAGKTAFEKYYRGVWTCMDEGDSSSTIAVVASLQNPRCARQVAQFVQKVEKIKVKATRRSAQTEMPFEELDFRMERVGEPLFDRPKDLLMECDHDLAVTDLADTLKLAGFRCGNHEHYDLSMINRSGEVTAIFQVARNHHDAGIYEGIARLVAARASAASSPKLVLVTSEPLKVHLEEKLAMLQISHMRYTWRGSRASFPNLENPLFSK